ncbi:MAG TPA: exosortase [Verrucomicrobiales bacterium]|nr:exosortase [Verrucomicrobiales bacterium]
MLQGVAHINPMPESITTGQRQNDLLDDIQQYVRDLPGIVRECWRGLPDKWLFGSLAVAWSLVFLFFGSPSLGYRDLRSPSLFYWMYYAYTNPGSEDTHGLLIPFVVLGLLLWKRSELLQCPKAVWWPGLMGLAVAGGIHLLGYMMQQQRVSIIGLFLGYYSLLALVWGRAFAARCFFPFILFAFCLPVGLMVDTVTFPLRQASTDIAVGVARTFFGVEVIQDGIRILDPNGTYRYEVAAACSGLRSLIAMAALTTIYGFVVFKTPWKQWLFVFISIPFALAGNVMRLLSIILAAESMGPNAGHFVHEWFGFLTFALTLAAVLWLGRRLEDKEPARPVELAEMKEAHHAG